MSLLTVQKYTMMESSLTVPDSPAEHKEQKGSVSSIGIPEYLGHRKCRSCEGNMKAHVGQRLYEVGCQAISKYCHFRPLGEQGNAIKGNCLNEAPICQIHLK